MVGVARGLVEHAEVCPGGTVVGHVLGELLQGRRGLGGLLLVVLAEGAVHADGAGVLEGQVLVVVRDGLLKKLVGVGGGGVGGAGVAHGHAPGHVVLAQVEQGGEVLGVRGELGLKRVHQRLVLLVCLGDGVGGAVGGVRGAAGVGGVRA